MSAATFDQMKIYLLGRFEIVQGERVLRTADWTRRKAAALLQRLALEKRLLKEQAIDFLWSEADLSTGANNLYRTIHVIRQTLDNAFGPGTAVSLFTFQDGIFSLSESAWVDVHQFEQYLQSANPSATLRASLQAALTLYTGPLLPDDPYSDWLIPHRERLRRLHEEASLNLAKHYREVREYDRAIPLIAALLADDPLDEPVQRELMRLYALNGRRHEALRQYQQCVDVLTAELGVPPEPETITLYEQILNGELLPSPAPATAWIPPAPTPAEVESRLPFVGREPEVETLRRQMHSAWQGRGQTILLAGDTGVGKTRLAYEALQVAAAAGMLTLFGAFFEQEGQLPYQPFIEAFNRYLSGQERPLSDNPITHHKPLGVSDPQQEHYALFNATTAFLAGLAGRVPLVLLVDDLHAADETSLRLFHFLARHTHHLPIILLATYRTDLALIPTSPFAVLLNSLYREQLRTIVNLAPLDIAPTSAIIAHTLEAEPASELIQAIFEVTEGNPFFTQEMARALVKWEQLEQRNGRWYLKPGFGLDIPAGLSGLLQERVARLGGAVVSTLQMAAIIGREFSFNILRRLTVLHENALLDALDTALAGHLLVETATGYHFCHGLIRRVMYDTQSQTRRARLHTLTAETIETVYAADLTPHVETLAHHYGRSDNRQAALPYLLQAGQKASTLFAFEVAVAYFEQALALMGDFGMDDPAFRWQILEPLGWWGIILADTPRTVRRFEAALALPASNDWQPASTDRVRMHRGAAMALITTGDTDAAEVHLMTALDLMKDAEETADYAMLLYNIAQLHWHRNEYQQAFAVAQRSLGIAEQLNDPAAIARAFEMLALACHSTGDWQQGLLFEEKRAELAGPALDVTEAFDVHL
jgi:predicted ATPase